ncbi:hypothetical protein [Desulfatitalea alkaliphila]|uniref:Uncharacterized protein n=1 Tax=Desulfatitalea alkaliphila TaxID=2929485 RepID=A0AA41R5J6_9BACT|nr:hypothetical protein [Desulfatitalea alkaliphila]MCJ8502206.1 hypothetical protein [Desulfatitalea alkaliphila]
MSYPYEWEPRLYRRMIFDNLQYYLSYGNQADLRRARYWCDRWSENDFEVLSTTDGYVGTAYYVEVLAEAVVALGCWASENSLKAYVLEKVYTDFGHRVSGESFPSALD